jgi:hypothetical protein
VNIPANHPIVNELNDYSCAHPHLNKQRQVDDEKIGMKPPIRELQKLKIAASVRFPAIF